jgi:hypothetical protein
LCCSYAWVEWLLLRKNGRGEARKTVKRTGLPICPGDLIGV